MRSHQQQVGGAFGAARRHGVNARTVDPCDSPRGATLTIAELEALAPIQMQHAAAQFIIGFLAKANTGYYGEECPVGGEDDRHGIDFRIKCKKDRTDIPVDFSLCAKGGFAVLLKPYWFELQMDGTYTFLQQYAQALIQAFRPAMNPDNHYELLRWKMQQRGQSAY